MEPSDQISISPSIHPFHHSFIYLFIQQTLQLGSFTLRKTRTATCHQHQYQNDHQHEDRDEHNVPRVLPPHLVLQSTSVRIEDEGLLVQVAGLIGELLDLLDTAENLV